MTHIDVDLTVSPKVKTVSFLGQMTHVSVVKMNLIVLLYTTSPSCLHIFFVRKNVTVSMQGSLVINNYKQHLF